MEPNDKTQQISKSIWIARDEAIVDADNQNYLERHPEKEYMYGQLHIFYDKPSEIVSGKWEGARDMCLAPTYMFPEIECGVCIEFKAEINILEY